MLLPNSCSMGYNWLSTLFSTPLIS
jgi:hypothetical protein